ncbi:MAG TPA: redox-sensing transcriptional repressor Rex [Hungateiclostridium thermocellum]|uniref:Redox-sensing transcriptional repressor Rex n=1 Tax=Acetivibrio thermocellus (strain ATCC 27405 / DSM 1237 / JCM 9322 / NBRC 103400 / NCIMB 10682 / NRRL B-4536 / VPI 7372) TaxID=203119 RepID=A3DCI1_ACET2|nr:redox-sensing transcriptional repressor Rex [Acetivibrio thermocellus]ABN51660.1 CoA-binding domain protein [Acetivibrio thermocellus ATCC 27405]HBW27059.1 redox-sensing transcriptional repressor Rex [Acetivibrio thermocellus]
MNNPKAISKQTLLRLPSYLSYLKSLPKQDGEYVSATMIASALGLNDVQVRKDLACVSKKGRPKLGYVAEELIRDIESFLGYDSLNDAIIVGAGRLGGALLSYEGFKEYGLNIVAAFDIDESKIGTEICGRKIFPLDKMKELCRRMKIRIGIITVPADSAQKVCDMLVDSGIYAIWNFAPVHLKVPDNILVQQENMAASLAVLSAHLAEAIKNNGIGKGDEENDENSE